jgi:hypothetical protein
MISAKRLAKNICREDDNTKIEFSEGPHSIAGVVLDLLAKCPPGAMIYGWHTLDDLTIIGVLVIVDGKEKNIYGRSKKMKNAMGRMRNDAINNH